MDTQNSNPSANLPKDLGQVLLDLLPIVADRGWDVGERGVIRDRDGRCPMCALANEIDPGMVMVLQAKQAIKEVFGVVQRDERQRVGQVVQILMDAADGGYYPDPVLLTRIRAVMRYKLGMGSGA